MSDLAEIQSQFVDFLQGKNNKFIDKVAEQPPVTTQTRIGIYHNAYNMRLRETIDTDHPVLGTYLGDQLYDMLVAAYIEAFPSTVKSLRHFCHNIPNFLQTNQPFSQHPILSEIAQFERLLLSCFDAKDANSATIEDLVAIAPESWPSITLTFHPSSAIFSQDFNAVESWQAIKSEHSPDAPTKADWPVYWLVWRNQQRLTEFYNIDPREQDLWQHFRRGGDFAQGCELLSQYYTEQQVPVEAVKILQNWLNKGIVSQINFH